MNAPDRVPEQSMSVPPHSIEAEQSVLGALLFKNDAYDLIVDLLRAEHFYRYDHRLIFEAVCRLIESNKSADVITVYEALQAQGKGEDIGGLAYLNSLCANVPGASNIRRYAEMVVNRWKMRGIVSTADEIGSAAFNPQGRSPDEIIGMAQTALERLSNDERSELMELREVFSQIIEDIDHQFHTGEVKRCATGFAGLDHLFNGGMDDGDLVIIGARPSMGKSALAFQIGEQIAERTGLPVAAFSLEMPAKQLSQRTMARMSGIPLARIQNGSKMLDSDWPLLTHAMQKNVDLPIFIDDKAAATLGHIRARTKIIKRRHGGLGLVIIDYLQLMGSTEGENRTQQIAANTRGLKALAKELKCPVIALSQLSRKLEERANKRPVMSDLRESGDIEQDADIILFIYRDEVYNPDSPDKGIAEIAIAKQRNGPLGRVGLIFKGEVTRFCELSPEASFGQAPTSGRAKRGFE